MSGGRGYDSYGSYSAGSGGRDGSNDFTRLNQSISNNIQKISQNVNEMQRMVQQIGTAHDSPELRDKLHQIQHYTNQLAKDTNKYMKDLSHLPMPQSQSEVRQWKIQKERLMNEFSSTLNKFQAAQRQAANKEKESVARVRAASQSAYDPFREDIPHDSTLVDLSSPTSPPKQQAQVVAQEDEDDLVMLQERENAIRQLESDIMDVNQIFKDLGVLVHEQGEMIDSIESNVESASSHVATGTEQLLQASNLQSKARRKKCIIILILVLVLGILATILGVTLSN